jgi:hypothetical protein
MENHRPVAQRLGQSHFAPVGIDEHEIERHLRAQPRRDADFSGQLAVRDAARRLASSNGRNDNPSANNHGRGTNRPAEVKQQQD